MANALINETSPYLLQHAHNPVNWYPWADEALQKAIEEDKPILVSIGYAACHWCHVMERESFEDPATAAIMNEHFINIKIDREERPDLDHIYMDAVQAMEGSGGWPLNVFLTPSKKPFYGGTYFPPQPVMNRPSWKDVLHAVSTAFSSQRSEIEEQANGLTQHLEQSNHFGIHNNIQTLGIDQIDTVCSNLLRQADKQWGGFGGAPKFPQTFSISFLLKYYHLEKKRNEALAHSALQQALLSLNKMIDGGIYDQLGGGLARYATDGEWLAPHFEKMLYDNALFVSVLSDAYSITQNEKYKLTIENTLAFVERELQHSNNGFYAALDADSEGIEGKFYTWSYQEVVELLGEIAPIYCAYYDISENGNWEHTNILRVLQPLKEFATTHNLDETSLVEMIQSGNDILFRERKKRIRPSLDDKIILGWNALMNIAFSKAYAATGNKNYRNKAIANMDFLLKAFSTNNHQLHHVWKNDLAKFPAFLDDYAYLIQALLQLYRITAQTDYLMKAKHYCKQVITDFSEPDNYFYYTPIHQNDVIVRKKEVYDGATPSGNATMALNLMELSIIFDIPEWASRAHHMIKGLSTVAVKYPTSFGIWLSGLYQQIAGTNEIVLIGNYEQELKQLLSMPLPHSILMASSHENNHFPMLKNKASDQPLTIYLCKNYSCQKPVHQLQDFIKQLQ